MVPANTDTPFEALDREARLYLFDAATERQRARQAFPVFETAGDESGGKGRGWTRDELYERGGPSAD